MTENKSHQVKPTINIQPQMVLFGFSFLVLLILFIAFASPVYPLPLASTAQPTCTPMSETDPNAIEGSLTPTPTPDLPPPTPEEIGGTDGIIIWATILIVILLAGTLRETLRRKGK